jgi:Ca2+-binding RTX toxin-like protein
VLFGGGGVDTLLGGAGSDTIYAADGERDVVDCGAGSDRAIVDAFDRATGCEVLDKQP